MEKLQRAEETQTVEELIAALLKLDPKQPVFYEDTENFWLDRKLPVQSVEQKDGFVLLG